MQEASSDEILEKILQKDLRYQRDAYLFLKEALDHTQKLVGKGGDAARPLPEPLRDKPQHVTGQQLLEGIRVCALEQFGPMAQTVLNEWGVERGEDFGEIVFNMVEAGLLAKTE